MSDDEDGFWGLLGRSWDALLCGAVLILGMIGIGVAVVSWFLFR